MVGTFERQWKGDLHARVRFLKGSIAYLLDELIDMLSEEGGHCSGPLRRQLALEFDTLQACLHELQNQSVQASGKSDAANLSSAAESQSDANFILHQQLRRLCDEVDYQSLSLSQLIRIQTEFRKLIHSRCQPALQSQERS